MKWKSNSGQTIVMALVGAVVAGIIMTSVAAMLFSQTNQQRFISQKAAVLDMQSYLQTTLSNAANCTCQFANSAPSNPNFANFANLWFDTTAAAGTQSISVKNFYSGCKGGPNSPILMLSNGTAIPGDSGVVVDKVQLVSLVPTTNPNEWQGQWQITFLAGTGSGAIGAIRPIQLNQKFLANTTTGGATSTHAFISACESTSGNSTVIQQNTQQITPGSMASHLVGPMVCDPGGCALENWSTYQFNIQSSAVDQYVNFTAMGIWDVRLVGGFGLSLGETIVSLSTGGGPYTTCAQNGYSGASGTTIDDTPVATASCIAKIPSGQAGVLQVVFHGKNGQILNPNPPYSYSSLLANAPMVSFYTIQ